VDSHLRHPSGPARGYTHFTRERFLHTRAYEGEPVFNVLEPETNELRRPPVVVVPSVPRLCALSDTELMLLSAHKRPVSLGPYEFEAKLAQLSCMGRA
jgi:hypothetical protein